MTFSPRLIEAKLALNMVHPEDFPMLAINALEADLDSLSIRKMSGLVQPSGYTIDLLLEKFMTETVLTTIPKVIAATRLPPELAREVIRSGADPLQFTRE